MSPILRNRKLKVGKEQLAESSTPCYQKIYDWAGQVTDNYPDMGDHKEQENRLSDMCRKNDLLCAGSKKSSEWILCQEIPIDIVIQVGESSFPLQKFPLVSKCGYIRKLMSATGTDDISVIRLADIPGGAESFELAARFCYGIKLEISRANIAMLRCKAEYLEMTEDYSIGNSTKECETYNNEVAIESLSVAFSILNMPENLIPAAERVRLVSRCIDAVACKISKDSQLYTSGREESSVPEGLTSSWLPKIIVNWYAEDLIVLRINIFQRVLMAMMARGFPQLALSSILMLYAQKSLGGLEIFRKLRKKIEPKLKREKRVILETIVSLLPSQENATSISFLSMLLRAAIFLEATVACRLDLEKKMGSQLGQAALEDLLIPSYSSNEEQLFDVDTVKRILMNYHGFEKGVNGFSYNEDDDYLFHPQSDIEKVGKVVEKYIIEIASDHNLTLTSFINLAKFVREQSRVTEDGMYSAIDTYLKAHPALGDIDRKRVCSLMDCLKLSREACDHAMQNDRLPSETVVQILHYQHQHPLDAMNCSIGGDQVYRFRFSKLKFSSIDDHPELLDELSVLRRENLDLKLEKVKMKMKMKEIELAVVRSATESPSGNMTTSTDKPTMLGKSFIDSVSEKFCQLGPFVRRDGNRPPESHKRPSKDRRRTIS